MDISEKVNIIKSKIESFEDFPKKGIVFRDVFSVLRDPPSFAILIDLFKIKVQELGTSIDAIVGLDSRGFIFGSVLAYDLQKPFVPIRKKGKLPGEIEKVNFKLEYGEVL
ncbi:Adenine phosphoribosyltransferase [Armadillidium nasatum]|uniref:adenine phosphoribosyltransferase n=1 Tax=Armadillidium nasatum TaxID=96803 RepID=A0A5N5T6Q1_9CRUS|nr:Adenine phosphoribosyltransferase [Armadillidium nasatum]